MASRRSRSSGRNKSAPSPIAGMHGAPETKEVETPSSTNRLGFNQDVAYCASNVVLGLFGLYILRKFDFLHSNDKTSLFVHSVALLCGFGVSLVYGKEKINRVCLDLSYLVSCSCWYFVTIASFGIFNVRSSMDHQYDYIFKNKFGLKSFESLLANHYSWIVNPLWSSDMFFVVGVFSLVMFGLTLQYLYFGLDADKGYASYSVILHVLLLPSIFFFFGSCYVTNGMSDGYRYNGYVEPCYIVLNSFTVFIVSATSMFLSLKHLYMTYKMYSVVAAPKSKV